LEHFYIIFFFKNLSIFKFEHFSNPNVLEFEQQRNKKNLIRLFFERASTVAAPTQDALPTGISRVTDAVGAK
jgi:hypothetical protein